MEALNNIFRLTPPNHVAAFAKLFCGLLAIIVSLNFKDQLAFFRSRPEHIYGKPIKLLNTYQIPSPTENQFIALGFVIIISLLMVTFGLYPKLFIIATFVSYFFYFNPISSLSYIQRKTNIIPLVLLVLLVSPHTGQPLDVPATEWELVLVKIALAQVYLSAAIQKLKKAGLKWADGTALQSSLMNNYLWSDSKAAFLLAQNKSLCAVFSTVTLIFELTFVLIVFIPWLSVIYALAALLFHFVILITMRINYLKYIIPVYAVFITDVLFFITQQ